ncbi:MAG TPA: glycine--tRNA ligase [Candidatus Binatia bacterium]|jgi:glycyl-tRNA synthetase|nr:glycine--tRNA ligase [Candidatus Binatia bacterium]
MAAGPMSVTMDKIVNLCKRRGFVFPSSEIYGGFASTWDYGPLGTELKRNIREAWWRYMVTARENVVGIESSVLMHPRVWEASGHIAGFSDPLIDCRVCKRRFRADQIPAKEERQCPKGMECDLTEARQFNLMFKTFVGPVEDDAAVAFLRPETAQGMFVNFLNVQQSSRLKPPFGIAQIGKSFRNEITPGNFIFRTREFEQMEMEFFVKPGADEEWFDYWREQRMKWYTSRLGIKPANLRFHHYEKDELAHYAKACSDIEYQYPFGWSELEGIANRTDFDLRQHAEYSGKDLTFFDEESRERYLPYVIEPAVGVDRILLIVLLDAYEEDVQENEPRVVLRLHPRLAPIKVGIFPLLRKEGQPEKALEIRDLLKQRFAVFYDQAGSIGRRYRRQDEVGTPFGVTVDHQTMQDNTVTLRDRDSLQQIRLPIDRLIAELITRIEA